MKKELFKRPWRRPHKIKRVEDGGVCYRSECEVSEEELELMRLHGAGVNLQKIAEKRGCRPKEVLADIRAVYKRIVQNAKKIEHGGDKRPGT